MEGRGGADKGCAMCYKENFVISFLQPARTSPGETAPHKNSLCAAQSYRAVHNPSAQWYVHPTPHSNHVQNNNSSGPAPLQTIQTSNHKYCSTRSAAL